MGELKIGRRLVTTTHTERVVFPRDGITKGEVLEYYRRIAPFMLPHLKKRRLTMQRFQPNIDASPIFQKEIPDHFPEWIPRVTVPKHGGEVTHIVCDNAETLVYIANQGCLTPHVGLQKIDKNEYPDQMVFDLDPSEDDFEIVRKVAFLLRDLLAEHKLTASLKTSGSRGIHLMIRLNRRHTFDEVRGKAYSIAEEMVSRAPDLVTLEMLKKNREGKLFLDVNRNATAQTIVPAFAIRAKDGAPVSMPITWEELADPKVNARTWTVRNAVERMEKLRAAAA